MKLITVRLARVIWLFPLQDLNPRGRYLVPFFTELTQRYNFLHASDLREIVRPNQGQSSPITFNGGSFKDPELGTIAVDLQIHRDGILADTHADTEASERFLVDALKIAEEKYDVVMPKSIRRRYISEVYVTSEADTGRFMPRLAAFMDKLSEAAMACGGTKYQSINLAFVPDQLPDSGPLFRFERAENVPFAEKRYWSMSGLKTAMHLEMLNELEKAIS